jgi:hypothetical protein
MKDDVKDEGRRMKDDVKDEGRPRLTVSGAERSLHPSSFRLHPSSLWGNRAD